MLQVPPQSPKGIKYIFPASGWLWEILAMTASFGCTVSVLAILVKMKDQPLSNWTFFLSLPATVAVFITLVKSTTIFSVSACIGQYKWLYFRSAARSLHDLDLFEEASRGPVGSFRLLAGTRWGLASIGAVATILALGSDALVQQVVKFTLHDVAVNGGNASFGLARHYSTGAQFSQGTPFTVEGMYPN
jgi:hypothetical protein